MGVTRKRIQSALTMAMRLPLRRAFCSRTTHVLMRKGSQTQPFSSLARRVYVNRGPRRVPHKQIVSRIREPAVKKKPNLLQPPPAIPHRRVKIPQHRAVEIAEPTREQLHNYFVTSAVPMVGFGFMDQTVMIQSGNVIDCTIGVTFGLSTLAAAAMGQIVSGAAAAVFGGTLDSLFRAAGLPRSGLTSAQRALPVAKRVNMYGNLLGVVTGCVLGLLNFLIIDTEQSAILKLQAQKDLSEFAYEVEASNKAHKDATTFVIRGPDVDGVLASVTSTLSNMNCSIVEVRAGRHEKDGECANCIEDVLVVRRNSQQIPNEELEQVAKAILEATSTPVHAKTADDTPEKKEQAEDLQSELQARIHMLERMLLEKQIKVEPSAA